MNIDSSIKQLQAKARNAMKRKNYDRAMELMASIAQLEEIKRSEDED